MKNMAHKISNAEIEINGQKILIVETDTADVVSQKITSVIKNSFTMRLHDVKMKNIERFDDYDKPKTETPHHRKKIKRYF